MSRRNWLAAVSLAWLLSGCAEPELEYIEVKRLDEPVTAAELKSFLAVIQSLPGQKVPPLPVLYLPVANWSSTRTLPVRELVQEEIDAYSDRWNPHRLASQLPTLRPLQAALRRERLTQPQFVGLVLALGVALSAEQVPASQDLKAPLIQGREIVQELLRDPRVFSSLSEDAAHYVLQQATWVTVTERLQRLMSVPDANRELIRAHREPLTAALPAEFSQNPLAMFDRILQSTGLPFEEGPSSGLDDELTWRRDDAIQGAMPLAPRNIPLR